MKLPGQAPIFLVALKESPNSSALVFSLLKDIIDSQLPNLRALVDSWTATVDVLPYGRVLHHVVSTTVGNATVSCDNGGVLGEGDRWCKGGKTERT